MIWLAVILIGQLADVITTKIILDRGGYEKMPLSRAIMERFGFGVWVAGKIIASVSVWYFAPPAALAAACIIGGAHGSYYALKNMKVIRNGT